MLILTRRIGEKIFIDEDIVITITRVNGDIVGVGIDAPKDRIILREEVYYKQYGGDKSDEQE